MTGLLLKLVRWPPFALLASLCLHAGVVALLLFSLSLDPTPLKAPDTDVIKAVIVDDGKVKAEIERIKKVERRKQQQKKTEKKELQRIKQQKEREKKKLADLKRKRLKEKERLKTEQAAATKKREAIKQQQAKEKKRLVALETKRKDEAKRLEKQRAKRKMEQEKKRKTEAEAKRKAQQAKEEKAQREALRKQMEAEESAERQRELARKSTTYIAAIRNKVQRNWRRPSGVNKGASCKVDVTQVPGGFVESVRVTSCKGGSAAFSKSVEKAVLKADPLPKAPDPSLFDRQIVFDFIVKE